MFQVCQRSVVEQLIEFWGGALPRTAPVFRVIREAAAVDPDAGALERARAAERLRNYETAGALLRRRGAPRDGLSVEQAAATIFAVGHPEIYRALVLEGNWHERRWATWARTTLTAPLLRD